MKTSYGSLPCLHLWKFLGQIIAFFFIIENTIILDRLARPGGEGRVDQIFHASFLIYNKGWQTDETSLLLLLCFSLHCAHLLLLYIGEVAGIACRACHSSGTFFHRDTHVCTQARPELSPWEKLKNLSNIL